MPTPTIPAGNLFMNATTYTGNGGTQTVANGAAGQNFQPNLVWVKVRSTTGNNNLFDSVRGVSNYLFSNSTSAETFYSGFGVTSFASNGFTLTDDSGGGYGVNGSGITYVGWNWKAGSTAVSNTSGTITSSVSANTTSGFSVVTYTGTGSNGTVGHGLSVLGVAPQMVILKRRDGAEAWPVYHVGMPSAAYYMRLNATDAQDTASTFMNNTAPTSTVFSVGTGGFSNTSGWTYVAYCWSPVAGYSAFGKYTGNGSADGPFIYTGFRPRWFMIKVANTTDNWYVMDSSCQTYNVVGNTLLANATNAEITSITIVDFLSNGFKIRNSASVLNGNGNTIIYAAFAENPFKYANAR
jgi:hypothetical protein